jgi:hypothetical protein
MINEADRSKRALLQKPSSSCKKGTKARNTQTNTNMHTHTHIYIYTDQQQKNKTKQKNNRKKQGRRERRFLGSYTLFLLRK